MILERPLKSVPTPALNALHRGIERANALSGDNYYDPECKSCALGSLSNDRKETKRLGIEYGFLKTELPSATLVWTAHFTKLGMVVSDLNDNFEGTSEERREFMLRHIVNELRERGKSIDGKAAEKELSQVSI